MQGRDDSMMLLVKDFCTPNAARVPGRTTVRECARAMHDSHVGSLVVIDEATGKPQAMLTDRDIAIECVAPGLDPDSVRAEDIASTPLVTVRDDQSLSVAVGRMRDHGLHRLAVVDRDGDLVGVLSATNAMRFFISEMDALWQAGSAGRYHEWERRGTAPD